MSSRSIKSAITFFIITGCFASTTKAAMDIVDATIVDVFQRNNEKFLCLSSDSSLEVIRKSIGDHLEMRGASNPPSMNETAIAAYTLYPCPFSPYREELRPATAKDIIGVWLYPDGSQKLRFGPKSPMWKKNSILPIKCESVAYYDSGEARNVQISGKMLCPFSTAKDMDISRKNPNVVQWQMIRDGMLKLCRSDVPGHIEEWEVFFVTKPFIVTEVQFNKGDIVAYLRRENGNDFYAATIFRHLKRLP